MITDERLDNLLHKIYDQIEHGKITEAKREIDEIHSEGMRDAQEIAARYQDRAAIAIQAAINAKPKI